MSTIRPLALWHDGTHAILWQRTPKGEQFLAATCSLPREARQDLLRTMVAELSPRWQEVNHTKDGEMAAVLLVPLDRMSPWAAEMPAENVIGFGDGFEGVPEVPAEYAVMVRAAQVVGSVTA